ncbi:hypothetical protein COZ60_01155 [Candidatus Bathyarchaeota archaeon CG_4_8_14_3_um_filter_42_8]|nr:MAG: hypothetical protein COZ60_01155 [Candidatus Bathyarchaeota archaeon CG_4_8_14_3_um_filter_42_8]
MCYVNVEFKVENTIRKMLKVIYGLCNSHLELASKSIKGLVKAEAHDMDIVDSLALHDALLLCSRLEKFGFKAGTDYGVYQCGARYGLMIKRGCSLIVNPILKDLQSMRMVWRIASTILREWRYMFGKCGGDVYEALDLAYRVMVMRNRLSDKKCPSCGKVSGTIIKEAVHGRDYSIYTKKICCNRREKTILRPWRAQENFRAC